MIQKKYLILLTLLVFLFVFNSHSFSCLAASINFSEISINETTLHEKDSIISANAEKSVSLRYYFSPSEDSHFMTTTGTKESPVVVSDYTVYFESRYNNPPRPAGNKLVGWKVFNITGLDDAYATPTIFLAPVWEPGITITYSMEGYLVGSFDWVFSEGEDIISYLTAELPKALQIGYYKYIGWKNSAGQEFSFSDTCPATTPDTFSALYVPIAPSSIDGTIPAGECYVESISEHKLGSSSYKVNNGADGCVYPGGITFYVPENGIYTFTAQ